GGELAEGFRVRCRFHGDMILRHLRLERSGCMVPFREEPAVLLDCPVDPQHPCRVFLPHQSPLEIPDNPLSQPTHIWNEVFLCLDHALAFARSARDIGLEEYISAQDEPIPPFWKIEYECGRENCGMPHTIYTGGPSDFSKIVFRILETNPTVP